MPALESFPPEGLAVVIGTTGGIGSAVFARLEKEPRFARVIGFSRRTDPSVDLTDEASIAAAAARIARQPLDLRLIILATGVLQTKDIAPEKSWRSLEPETLARTFAVNAIGPALLMKHFLPLLPRADKSIFATLSARVGSIGDNQLGGWYGYRASKAALNQFVRTAAIELTRQRPDAICVALHPGTVDTALSAPHAKTGLDVRTPDQAAALLLATLDRLTPENSGQFWDLEGREIAW